MVTCIQTHILSLYISKNEWSVSLSKEVGPESKEQSQNQQQQQTKKTNSNLAKSLTRLSVVSAHDVTLQRLHAK